MKQTLKPRLNYRYTLGDAFLGIVGLCRKDADDAIIRERLGVDEVLWYNHARVAMRIALSALKLPAGSGIAVTAYNCLTVFNSVTAAGYRPVFVDITDDFQIDFDDLMRKKDQVKAVVVNHFFGIPNHTLLKIRETLPNLPIVEDCAHSLGTQLEGKQTGLWGDMAMFSYGMSKFPSVRDGGFMIVNNSKYLADIKKETAVLPKPSRLAELKNIAMGLAISFLGKPFIYKNFTLPFLKEKDNKKDFGGKYAQTERSAYKSNKYVFLHKMRTFDTMLAKQQHNAVKLLSNDLDGVSFPYREECNFFMLPALCENSAAVIAEFRSLGIEIGQHFSKSILWAKEFGYDEGNCANAEKICKSIVTFPTYYFIR